MVCSSRFYLTGASSLPITPDSPTPCTGRGGRSLPTSPSTTSSESTLEKSCKIIPAKFRELSLNFPKLADWLCMQGLAKLLGCTEAGNVKHSGIVFHISEQGFRVKEGLSCVLFRAETAEKITQPIPSLTRKPCICHGWLRNN